MNGPARRGVHRFLRERNFRLVAPAPGAVTSYEGPLNFRGTDVASRIDVIDWGFKIQPQVRLLERPAALTGFRPHLGRSSTICYVDRESVYMDPYDPLRVIARCLLGSCPTAWCTSRESWFGWTRAQLTTADNRVVLLSVSVCSPSSCM